jgi:hypothetical protein
MLYDYTIPPIARTLGALSGILTKAEAHCAARNIDPSVLLSARLFPDMFPFTRQVQLTCDFAARGVSRLAAADLPSFPDTEASFSQLFARIAAAHGHIDSFARDRFAGAEARSLTIRQRSGDLTLTGAQFLTLYCLPQFYFHATTAYDILRHNGVEIGKADFLGE